MLDWYIDVCMVPKNLLVGIKIVTSIKKFSTSSDSRGDGNMLSKTSIISFCRIKRYSVKAQPTSKYFDTLEDGSWSITLTVTIIRGPWIPQGLHQRDVTDQSFPTHLNMIKWIAHNANYEPKFLGPLHTQD